MSSTKNKRKKETELWQECVLCNLLISSQEISTHQYSCFARPLHFGDVEDLLDSIRSINDRPDITGESKGTQKNITPRRLFEDTANSPKKESPDNATSNSGPSEFTHSKPQGFCFQSKLFATFAHLPQKGSEVKNVPSTLLKDLVYLHPSTMHVCGIGIGDTVTLTSAGAPQRLCYAWPYVSSQPATVSLLDKIYNPGGLVKVQFYPLPVLPASQLFVVVPIDDDRCMKEKMEQVTKIQLSNRLVTKGSEFMINFFGRKVQIKVQVVSGHSGQSSVSRNVFVTDDLLDTFEKQCSLENSSAESVPTSVLSPVAGFRKASAKSRKQVVADALKEQHPQFYRIDYSTKVIIVDAHHTKERQKEISYECIGGLDNVISSIKEIMEYVFRAPKNIRDCGVSVPKGVILFGPPGTGKTLIMQAIKQEEGLHCISLSGPDIFSKYFGETESKLKNIFEEAIKRGPSLIFLDDVDILCPRREQSTDQEKRFLNALLQLIDNIESSSEQVFLMAGTNRLDSVDLSLRRPGRLDILIEVPVPTPVARVQILKKLLKGVKHELLEKDIASIADKAHSFTGGDLAMVVREAVHACIKNNEMCTLTEEVMSKCAKSVTPSAMKEVTLEVPKVYWGDIGGQKDLKLKLQQSVEWPLKHPEAFTRLGIKPPHGLLMYGPPGCSKTLIAKALATESGLNFLAIKGPELFNKWVGESERAVREVFRKARAAAPSVIFFDEIDALAAERSGGATSVGNRVLAQLLNEMDGVEALEGVTVVAATNRPDMIDKALLRPGRLDRVIYVPLPDGETRREILQIQIRKMPVAPDVDLELLVSKTEGYSGAEVVAVCQEAGLLALSESLTIEAVRGRDFEQALHLVQPRTDAELIKFYEKYHSQSSFGPF